MQEIKCPKCGEVFQVDESGYAAIVKQVRDKEFGKEIRERETQFETEKESAIKLARAEEKSAFQSELAKKEAEIAKLKSEIEAKEKDRQLAVTQAVAGKEKELAEKDKKIYQLSGDIESGEDRKSVV